MSGDIEVQVNWQPLRKVVRRWENVTMPRSMRQHFNKVGSPAAAAYRAALPGKSGIPYVSGALRRSVQYKVFAKRTGSIGIAVAPMGKNASGRHLVEFGTRPHDMTAGALYVAEQMVVDARVDPQSARFVAFGMARRIKRSGTRPAAYAERAGKAAELHIVFGLDEAVQAAINQADQA